jgi:hypothetical protein
VSAPKHIARRRLNVTQDAENMEARILKVPGAALYYEIRGSGPLLLLITGGPTDAGTFTDLSGRLSDR